MSRPTRVLSLDLGTTAVKAAVVDVDYPGTHLLQGVLRPVVVASAVIATDAYVSREHGAAEQDVGRVLAAIDAAVGQLRARGALAGVSRVACCGQMHGLLLLDTRDPQRTSRLVTWEDAATPPGLVCAANAALFAAGAAPVFAGYGALTLLRLLRDGHPWVAGAAAFDAAATLAAYVACVAAMPPDGPAIVRVDPTDAAALGFFTLDVRGGAFLTTTLAAVAATGDGRVAARDPAGFLPAVVPSGTTIGVVTARGAATLRAPSLRALAGVPVTVALGDHPAVVAGTLALTAAGRGGAAAAVVIVNIGTSAQAVCVRAAARAAASGAAAGGTAGTARGSEPPLSTAAPSVSRGPCPCEERPCAPTTPLLPGDPNPTMSVVASVNGGNVLARLAAAAVAAAPVGRGGGLDDAYATLEAAAAEWDAVAADAAAAAGGDRAALLALLFAPERSALGWCDADDSCSGGLARAALPAAGPGLLLPEVGGGDVEKADVLAARLASLSPDALGALYAAAARRVVDGVLDSLPSAAWAPDGAGAAPAIIATGGAFGRSAALRAALHRAAARLRGGAPASAGTPAGGVSFLSRADAEFVACVGAAVVATAGDFPDRLESTPTGVE